MRIEQIAAALLQIDRAADTLADEGEIDAADTLAEEASSLRRRHGLQGLTRAELMNLSEGLEEQVRWSHAIATRGATGVVVHDWYKNRRDAEADPRVREGTAEAIPRSELPDEYELRLEVD